MAPLECPRCRTRFDTIFAASDRCPYCIARGVDPAPALRREHPPRGKLVPNGRGDVTGLFRAAPAQLGEYDTTVT